jgi:hypothetical protein
LRGSGAFHGGTVLVPPKHFPKTLCNGGFGPMGVCVLAKSLNPKTGAVRSAPGADARMPCVEDCWHTGEPPGMAIRGDR